MDVDQKIKELKDLFAKTGEELSELVRNNEKFVKEEMQKVEETVRRDTEVAIRILITLRLGKLVDYF
ncbi:hypothetical protein K0M31_015864 [Melipona bicolor]|uniref:Uncharacterized protein n=1 Tax=Melipona bicolor TaxID=60889 RepID=A0AA40G784_9HYME|nr:hypothetical protein K0M31_015864 [Melipona bicolor]